MFVDASAMTAVISEEPDWKEIAEKIHNAGGVATSPLSMYETVMAIARTSNGDVAEATRIVQEFLQGARCGTVDITARIGQEAVSAFARFGKGRHRAGLNMGDCFAYACARVHRVPLLCKGDDFIHTDIQIA